MHDFEVESRRRYAIAASFQSFPTGRWVRNWRCIHIATATISIIVGAAVFDTNHASAADDQVERVDPAIAAKSRDPTQYASALTAIRFYAQTSPQRAADNSNAWVRALLYAGHNAEAAQACDVLMPLRHMAAYRFNLLDVRGWAMIRSGNLAGGVGSLLEASRQPPGHPDRSGEWASSFDNDIYATAIAAAESGSPDLAQSLVYMCTGGIMSKPEDIHRVQKLQTRRVQLLLAQGHPHAFEALSQAKSLYNVCSMEQTASAMLLVSQALLGTDPSGVMAERFKQEQVAGASELHAARPADVAQISQPDETVLRSIHVNGTAYDARIAALGKVENYHSLVGRGNLLLLVDRPAEARIAFEAAYTVADADRVEEASESLARCYRAEDGTIGRANAWVAALRPRPPQVTFVSPTAQLDPVTWYYTTDLPADLWQSPGFDAAGWHQAVAPFGGGNLAACTTYPRTEWKTADVWLRRSFVLPSNLPLDHLHLLIERDDEAQVYINGVLAAALTQPLSSYTPVEISGAALASLKPGRGNVLAVHAHNVGGDQIIDVGLVYVTDP